MALPPHSAPPSRSGRLSRPPPQDIQITDVLLASTQAPRARNKRQRAVRRPISPHNSTLSVVHVHSEPREHAREARATRFDPLHTFMSQANTTTTETTATDELDEYAELLDHLDVALDEAIRKIEDGRIRDAQREQARCRYLNTLVKIVRERRQVLEARDLEEMSRELDELKSRQDWQ